MLICTLKVKEWTTRFQNKEAILLTTQVRPLLSSLAEVITHKTQHEVSDAFLVGFDMPDGVQCVYILLLGGGGSEQQPLKISLRAFKYCICQLSSQCCTIHL